LYNADLMSLIVDNGFSPHLYADETQVYGSYQPVEIDAFSAKLSDCIGVVSNWMRSNKLVYNRSTAASTSNHCIVDRRRPGLTGYIRQEPGHLHQF